MMRNYLISIMYIIQVMDTPQALNSPGYKLCMEQNCPCIPYIYTNKNTIISKIKLCIKINFLLSYLKDCLLPFLYKF